MACYFYDIEKNLYLSVLLITFFSLGSTAELENINNLILMYSGKRFAFSPLVYRARCQLASLDYKANVDREVKRNSDGKNTVNISIFHSYMVHVFIVKRGR